MIIYQGLTDLPSDFFAGAVTIGNFDGVHHGHARIMRRVVARAQQFNGPSVVFTFEPHPVRLLRPEAAPPPLTWVNRKVQLLKDLNVDVVIAYPTDHALLALSPAAYFQQIVCDRLRAKAIVEGPNFFFGKDRAGDIQRLAQLCEEHGQSLDIVEPLKLGDDFVSSSRVRRAIAAGDMDAANAMLTRPYRIRGMVMHGAGRGAKIGFPTANVSAIDTLLPAPGVYAGLCHRDGRDWPAAINVGPNPTFGEDKLKIEAHLIDFAGNLYGMPLEVDLLSRLRDIQPFESVDQLANQLAKDVDKTRQIAQVSLAAVNRPQSSAEDSKSD